MPSNTPASGRDAGQGRRVESRGSAPVRRLEAVAAADRLPRRHAPRRVSRLSSDVAANAADGRGREQDEQHGRRGAALASPAARRARGPGRGRGGRWRRQPRSAIGYSRTTTIPAATPTRTGTAAISGSNPPTAPRELTACEAALAEQVGGADRERHDESLDHEPAGADPAHDAVAVPAAGPARADDRHDRRHVTTVTTAIATTAAAATIVGDRVPAGTSAMAIAAASDRARARRPAAPSTMTGHDHLAARGAAAPRERHRRPPPARRPARRSAPSVATATSAGPSAMTAMIPSAAAQRAWCASSIVAIPVRSAVSVDGVTLADG